MLDLDRRVRGDGGLDRLSLSELRVGDWLRAPVVLIGTGKGRVPKVQVAGGAMDLRRLPDFGGTGAKGGGGSSPRCGATVCTGTSRNAGCAARNAAT
mgnify:CR=1 FL=1